MWYRPKVRLELDLKLGALYQLVIDEVAEEQGGLVILVRLRSQCGNRKAITVTCLEHHDEQGTVQLK